MSFQNARKQRTAMAMSGGVDSAAAAALLKAGGTPVFGLTAVMTPGMSRCCSTEDVERARSIADALGIEHHVVDLTDPFERGVIRPFESDYLAGRTPSPCVLCNERIKFAALFDAAAARGATRLATGHYARIERRPGGGIRLLRGRDTRKDQSYFLARLAPEQLARSVFPLGDMEKREVSGYVANLGLPVRAARESQELCFVTEGTHGDWLDLRVLRTPGPGEIVDRAGRVLGRHAGIHHYTIGQRKGLGVAVGRPVYVIALDAARNRVVVGDRRDALSETLAARSPRWMPDAPPGTTFRAAVQIRYNHRPAPAAVRIEGSRLLVRFDTPQFAVTPGQLAVFYDGDAVIGSAWITGKEPDL